MIERRLTRVQLLSADAADNKKAAEAYCTRRVGTSKKQSSDI